MTRRSAPSAPPAPASAGGGAAWPAGWLWAGIFVTVLLAYLPALSGGILWDDAGHVTRLDLRSWDGLLRIWFEFGATQQYYPLLHSAFWAEHFLWGDATLGYHLVNVLQHAAAACLFGTLLRRLGVPGAWFAALLFALHPVCAESVAWISEQKNTLSAVFYLGAALAYLRFDPLRSSGSYALATGLFLLALLTKTVTATLPAALLVVLWWRRGRLEWRRDVGPLLPWFVLGAVSGLVTAHFERTLIGAQGADFNLSWIERGLLAGRIFWFYLGKLAWPAQLAFVYPRWTVDPAQVWQWLFSAAALLLLAGLVWWQRRQRGPLAAALLFAGALFPVLGFVNVYPFIFSFVADHFQYLASLPVFALAAAGLVRISAPLPGRSRRAGGLALLALLGILTWNQSENYRDAFTLYQATLRLNPACWMAHNNLAITLATAGRVEEAVPHLEAALKLRPDYAEAENNLGDDLLQLHRPAEAVPHFERAIQIQPGYAIAHCNLGLALAALRRPAEAIPRFATAVRLDPVYAQAELNWGISLMLTNRTAAALPHFARAVALDPASPNCRNTYGHALMEAGRFAEAGEQFEQLLRLNPASAETHLNLALVLRQLGRRPEALAHYTEALRLDPGLANAR